MSNGPKISIITACYNAEKTIEQTIQSVLSQTYDNIEYIIIDGASTDGTMEIVRKYESEINIIISEPDRGIYDAFNKGARAASGDYIQYLNADDYLYSSDVIQIISDFIKQNREKVLIYGGILRHDEATDYKLVRLRQFTFEEIQQGNMIPHPATFLRREVILELGLFDDQYDIAADYDLICRVFKKYNSLVAHYPEFIATFRIGGISSDIRNSEKLSAEIRSIAYKHFGNKVASATDLNNEALFKNWLEKKIFFQRSISDILKEKDIKKVALWGTGELSVIIWKELVHHNVDVVFYVDNDKQKQGLSMNNVQIMSPEYLKENYKQIDCLVMSFEGRHEESVLQQLESYNISSELLVYSWRDLVVQL